MICHNSWSLWNSNT